MIGAQAQEKDLASPSCLQRVKVGDLVHVFEGTVATRAGTVRYWQYRSSTGSFCFDF